jgi:flagellar biosynthesis protein FlhB
MHDLGADIYCCSAHKWLLAPKGNRINPASGLKRIFGMKAGSS